MAIPETGNTEPFVVQVQTGFLESFYGALVLVFAAFRFSSCKKTVLGAILVTLQVKAPASRLMAYLCFMNPQWEKRASSHKLSCACHMLTSYDMRAPTNK